MDLGQARGDGRMREDDPQERLVPWRASAQVAELHQAPRDGDLLLDRLGRTSSTVIQVSYARVTVCLHEIQAEMCICQEPFMTPTISNISLIYIWPWVIRNVDIAYSSVSSIALLLWEKNILTFRRKARFQIKTFQNVLFET